jgi:DNA-binding XRE family transcriptional regulator
MELTEVIKKCRGNRTQEEFAELLGVSRQSVNQWEVGSVIPKQEHLEKMGIRGHYVLQGG